MEERDHLDAQEREELQRVVQAMREGAGRLPTESAVGALLERSAEACLRLIPGSRRGHPQRPPSLSIPVIGMSLAFGGAVTETLMGLL
jgi:hypothetical protein